MSSISIPLSEEDLTFLRRFTGQRGITVEDFMAQHAKNLRLNLEAILHRDIIAATGTFQTATDPQNDYYDHQEHKHR
jgi:uncharacterized protein involved in type VI secretion and phage assembly